MLMVSLSNNNVVYITPAMCNTFTPNCDEVYTVGRALSYHQILKCYVPTTRGYRRSITYRLGPFHWTLPVVSEQDKTVNAATNLLAAFQQNHPHVGCRQAEVYYFH